MKVVISLGVAVLVLLLALFIGTERRSNSDNTSGNESSSSSSALSQRKSWPVEKVPDRSPTVADIEFVDFDFEQFAMSRYGPSASRIDDLPSKGAKYFVTPELTGVEAITTLKFEAVDQQGALIGVIPVLQTSGPDGEPFFYGVILIPDRPFRVVARGQAIDGGPFKVTTDLFVPRSEPPKPNAGFPLDDENPQKARQMLALLKDAERQEYSKVEQEFAKLKDGTIVMPRTRVFNVNYAVIFSPSGRPLGFRIDYDVEFSQDGWYSPGLTVTPDFENHEWRGKMNMGVHDGSIEPKPIEESPQVRSHPLDHGAGYVYRANTTYHFTAELFPDYVIRNEQKTKFCLYNQVLSYDPQAVEVRKAILASKAPITYRVSIKNSDFEGLIEKFYSHNELYNSFVAEGAVDCGPQPTNRF
ncbi:MAG TPA: hypothetical protein VJM50_05245 [Pyrinomonadaceae bacterium]|nr:hypothetical protein [Pyrinomonadaceae bacterium]